MSIRTPSNVLAGVVIHTVGTSAPASPATGAHWLDTSGTPILKVWNGSAWVLSSAGEVNVLNDVTLTTTTPAVAITNGAAGGIVSKVKALVLNIANAVAGGAAGLLSGSDKALIDHMIEVGSPPHFRVASPTGYVYLTASFSTCLAANCYYDGTNWQRYDTGSDAAVCFLSLVGTWTFLTKGAGANPIGTWATTDVLGHGDFDKLHNWPRTRLNFIDATDELNGTGGAAGVEFTLTTSQSFAVNSSSSLLQIDCDLLAMLATAAAGSAEVSVRAVIDLAGSPIRKKISGGYSPGPTGSFFPVTGGSFKISGLAAGTHTICLTAKSNNAVIGYLRCNTQSEYEHAAIYVMELTP